jgi:hypothetical protein
MRVADVLLAGLLAGCAHRSVPLPVIRAGDRDAAPAACWEEPGKMYWSDTEQRYTVVQLARAIVSALSRPGPYDGVFPGLAGIRAYRADDGYPVYVVTPVDLDGVDLPPRLHLASDPYAADADVYDHHHDVFVVELRVEGAVRSAGGSAVRVEYSFFPHTDVRDPDRTRWRFGYLGQICAVGTDTGELVLYGKALLES